jgi:phage shock protein A
MKRKKFLYWLMGDRAGMTLVAVWNWLWGKPMQQGGQISEAVAEEAIQQMQQEVFRLAEAVAQVTAGHQSIRDEYLAKRRELQQAEKQAELSQRNGYKEAARLAMTKVIHLERVLEQLDLRQQQAEQLVHTHQATLKREREKLELYKIEYQNLKSTVRVDDALDRITRITGDLNVDSARNQFETVKSAITDRHHRINALAQLAENPAERLQADLDQLSLEEAVNLRLQAIARQPDPEVKPTSAP